MYSYFYTRLQSTTSVFSFDAQIKSPGLANGSPFKLISVFVVVVVDIFSSFFEHLVSGTKRIS